MHSGLLRRGLWWLRDGLQSSMAWWRLSQKSRAPEGQEAGVDDEGRAVGVGGQGGQRAERVLQQSLAGQLSAYPGQASTSPSAGAGTGQAAGQAQSGNPRALFPTLIGSPPTTPPPQQLLQVTNNGDASQQPSSSSTPLQSVDSASAFSALDVGSTPSAITSPSVTIVNNSPCKPFFPVHSAHMLPYGYHPKVS